MCHTQMSRAVYRLSSRYHYYPFAKLFFAKFFIHHFCQTLSPPNFPAIRYHLMLNCPLQKHLAFQYYMLKVTDTAIPSLQSVHRIHIKEQFNINIKTHGSESHGQVK